MVPEAGNKRDGCLPEPCGVTEAAQIMRLNGLIIKSVGDVM